MNLFDFRPGFERDAPAITPAIRDADDHWRELVGDISAEIAGPLAAAAERLRAILAGGRVDAAGIRALEHDVQRARQISVAGQQLARLASGTLQQSPEPLALTETLRRVLAQRGSDPRSRHVHVQQVLKPAEVMADASLLCALLEALLDWSLTHAKSVLDLRLDTKNWPPHARLNCRFAYRAVDEVVDDDEAALHARRLDTIGWRLLEQTAWTMALLIDRKLHGPWVELTIEFPRTLGDAATGARPISLDDCSAHTIHAPAGGQGVAGSAGATRPTPRLAGRHVVVVAQRRDLRTQVRDAIRPLGVFADLVCSVDEARALCGPAAPDAVIVETALRNEQLLDWRTEMETGGADIAFIEIIDEGNRFEVSGFGGLTMARVGRDAIGSALPSALVLELSKLA